MTRWLSCHPILGSSIQRMWEAPFVRWRHHGNARGHDGQVQGQEDESQNDERQKLSLTCFRFFLKIQFRTTPPLLSTWWFTGWFTTYINLWIQKITISLIYSKNIMSLYVSNIFIFQSAFLLVNCPGGAHKAAKQGDGGQAQLWDVDAVLAGLKQPKNQRIIW